MTISSLNPTHADATTLPSATRQSLRFQVGERTIWRAYRRLIRVGHRLSDLLANRPLCLPALSEGDDGYDIRSLPADARALADAASKGMVTLERQRYPRHFIRLSMGYAAYMDGFSAKTRSTFRRKRKRWSDAAGGLDVRAYRTPAEVGIFYGLARALSARTYQERLLDAGLPDGPDALETMQARAAENRVRAYILFHAGVPASYLYLPIDSGCVIYAYLGYEPTLADLSPGTVLQLEALERLFAEGEFEFFDFTEGDGAHKRLFGSECIECVDLLMLRDSIRNHVLVRSISGFDAGVRYASGLAERSGVKTKIRRLLRQ